MVARVKSYPHYEDKYAYYSVPWIARELMGNFFDIINLNKVSDTELATQGSSGMMKLLLKRAAESKFVDVLKRDLSFLRLIEEVSLKEIVELSTNYALEVGKGDAEEILEAFAEIYPNLEKTIMTAARQLEKRGMKQGMQQGMQQVAKKMLRAGSEIGFIENITGLRRDLIEALYKN